jgi:hypothetical protein
MELRVASDGVQRVWCTITKVLIVYRVEGLFYLITLHTGFAMMFIYFKNKSILYQENLFRQNSIGT